MTHTRCSTCGNEIGILEIRCPHCGKSLDPADSISDTLGEETRRVQQELESSIGDINAELDRQLRDLEQSSRELLDDTPGSFPSPDAPAEHGDLQEPTEPAAGDVDRPIGRAGSSTATIAPVASAKRTIRWGQSHDALTVEVNHLSWLNFALCHANVSPVQDITLTNHSLRALNNPLLEIAIAPREYGDAWQQTLGRMAPGDHRRLESVRLPLSRDRLQRVVENERANLKITVTEKGAPLVARTLDIDIQPFNHWMFMFESLEYLAAFVTPNQPALTRVIAEAAELLEQRTGDTSLAGYQMGGPQRIRQIVAALHDALALRGVDYINPPAVGLESGGQKIRSVGDTLEGGRGTCLDLTVLLAALMEQVGLRPLVVLVPGHAFVGCWTTEESFDEAVVDIDAWAPGEAVAENQEHLLVLNSVDLCQRCLFDEAEQAGLQWIQHCLRAHRAGQRVHLFLIDIHACRQSGITPLS